MFSLFIQLYIAKVPIGSGSGENFLDPTKQDRIRIRNPGKMCLDENLILLCTVPIVQEGGVRVNAPRPAHLASIAARLRQSIFLPPPSCLRLRYLLL